MATLAELDETVATARAEGCRELILLKCTSSYPASPENSNLATIAHMRALFDCEVGLSDHSMGIGTALTAIALGASVIEKHFTLARIDGGVDSAFSLEPAELGMLVRESERAWQSLGRISYGPTPGEVSSLKFRRSLYIVEDMKQGDMLTCENLQAIRPGLGLPTKYQELVLGKRVVKDVSKGTPLDWQLLLS
jgi:N-acetylneuraminate synthase